MSKEEKQKFFYIGEVGDMNKREFEQKYTELFPSDTDKAEAFDEIAKQYYYGNFGRMQKTDFETLLFSLYLERILNISEEDIHTYSDYTLSKLLGITQAKVSNLKVKKELQYPYEGFDWKKSFLRVSSKARYENGKIRINILDKNLYYELKNAIEKADGYVEVQMNSSVLQISPEDFITLMTDIGEEKDRITVRKKLKEKLEGTYEDTEFLEKKSISEILKNNAHSMGTTLVADLIEDCVPVVGKYIANIIKESVVKE